MHEYDRISNPYGEAPEYSERELEKLEQFKKKINEKKLEIENLEQNDMSEQTVADNAVDSMNGAIHSLLDMMGPSNPGGAGQNKNLANLIKELESSTASDAVTDIRSLFSVNGVDIKHLRFDGLDGPDSMFRALAFLKEERKMYEAKVEGIKSAFEDLVKMVFEKVPDFKPEDRISRDGYYFKIDENEAFYPAGEKHNPNGMFPVRDRIIELNELSGNVTIELSINWQHLNGRVKKLKEEALDGTATWCPRCWIKADDCECKNKDWDDVDFPPFIFVVPKKTIKISEVKSTKIKK